MALNIDRVINKTVKQLIVDKTAISCGDYKDECKDIEIVFSDNSSIKIQSVTDNWIEIWVNNRE